MAMGRWPRCAGSTQPCGGQRDGARRFHEQVAGAKIFGAPVAGRTRSDLRDTGRGEAQAIAIALREAVEEPARTAALVTPDRALARRVAAHLRRWSIEADDSAGEPLSATAPGTLLLGLAEALADDFAPVSLLALLKHPLTQAGDGRLEWLEGVRLLDHALRGPRPPAGTRRDRCISCRRVRDAERKIRQEVVAFWQSASSLLRNIPTGGGLGALLAALREGSAALAGDGVWAGPAGRQAAELIASIEAAANSGPEIIRIESLPAMLRDLFDGVAVRPPQGGHPRIFIRGLIEARISLFSGD